MESCRSDTSITAQSLETFRQASKEVLWQSWIHFLRRVSQCFVNPAFTLMCHVEQPCARSALVVQPLRRTEARNTDSCSIATPVQVRAHILILFSLCCGVVDAVFLLIAFNACVG